MNEAMSQSQIEIETGRNSTTMIPSEYPSPDWTPKQHENWETYGKAWYDLLETEGAKEWARRCWRPKQRNDGLLKRDHVKMGTPEDYIVEHVNDTFNPWGSIQGLVMRSFAVRGDTDELDDVVSEIVKAKLLVLKEKNPEKAKRLLQETDKVARLYGLSADSEGEN